MPKMKPAKHPLSSKKNLKSILNMADSVMKAVKEINFKTTTTMLNTVGFLGYALDEHNFAYDERLRPNEVKSLRISSMLLAIAGVHYSMLDVSEPSPMSEILIRYSDWFLTTPMLLMVLCSFYELNESVQRELIIYNVLMIFFGFLYEITKKHSYWLIGTGAYALLVSRLYKLLPEHDLFYRYFVLGWSAYGLVSLLPIEKRFIPYNIMDGYNKLAFAMEIRHKIQDRIRQRSLVFDRVAEQRSDTEYV
jgi:hypothetical protein